jgi:radical SAM superfamily enzyme YgiQ (UPF0313 family)
MVNRRPDALAERTYAPWPDMAKAMRDAAIPLYTLESYRPVRDFDAVGISLQSELNFINVPLLLDLAGVPVFAEDRGDDEPLVIGGGPCTANPEPVADFFDAILIGDAEAALDDLLDAIIAARAEGLDRLATLRRIATIPGMYVPRFYSWSTDPSQPAWTVTDDVAPLPVQRVWVDTLDPDDQPPVPIVPYAEVVQDRLGMEIMRGCTQGCRFCQAGYWYRPVREHDPKVVLDRMERQVEETGFEEVGLLSLSSADYSQIEPLVYNLSERLADRRVSVSLPSLRADAFSVGLAEAVSRVRKSGFTFAPETGSDRLRRVINKTFTNADMLQAAEAAFAKGWNLIKVYAMIGLPTETDDDLEELAVLAEDLIRVGRQSRGRSVQVKVVGGLLRPQELDALPVGALRPGGRTGPPHPPAPRPIPPHQGRQAHLERPPGIRARGPAVTGRSTPGRRHPPRLAARRHVRRLGRTGQPRGLGPGPGGERRRPRGRTRPARTRRPPPVGQPGRRVRKNYLKSERRRGLREDATADCKWAIASAAASPATAPTPSSPDSRSPSSATSWRRATGPRPPPTACVRNRASPRPT